MNKWIEWFFKLFALYLFVCCVGAVLLPHHYSHENAWRAGCQSHLKRIGLALRQYQDDHDDRFPRNTKHSLGWADALQPYTPDWDTFQCPKTKAQLLYPTRLWRGLTGSLKETHTSDYWYNGRLTRSGLTSASIKSPALVIAFGDGVDNAPTSTSISQLPSQWSKDDTTPAKRHFDGTNVAFVDGHVKWYRPQKVTSLSTRMGLPTFQLQ